jgi:transcriptional regulator with XRE-family HTH domain
MIVNHGQPPSLMGDDRSRSWWNAGSRAETTWGRDLDKAAWKAFGEWVEQLRVRTGLQVGDVAERAGVSRVWLQEIRKGGRGVPGGWRLPNPKEEALVRLARVLNVPPEEMLARAGRRTATATGGGAGTYPGSSDPAARVQELEQQVRQQERELAELRRRLEEREERASGR